MARTLPIFVLSLPEMEARRAPLRERLSDLGLPHEVFFGVDGRDGLPAACEPMIDRSARVNRSRRPMTDGEYACALSHLFIHRAIVERALPWAIVLEDDAIVGTSLAAVATGRIALAGDLLLLDHRQGLYRRSAPVGLGDGFSAHRVAAAPNLTTGYAINLDAARFFLEHAFPVRMLADWSCDIRQLRSFAVHPRVVEHPDMQTGASTIRDAREEVLRAYDGAWRSRMQRWRHAEYWRRWVAKRWYRRLDDAARLDVGEHASSAAGSPRSSLHPR